MTGFNLLIIISDNSDGIVLYSSDTFAVLKLKKNNNSVEWTNVTVIEFLNFLMVYII